MLATSGAADYLLVPLGLLGLRLVALSAAFLRFFFPIGKLFQPSHGIAVEVRPVRDTKLVKG